MDLEPLLLRDAVESPCKHMRAFNARRIHQILLERFRISERRNTDFLKHSDTRRYTYALTEKRTRIALLFVLFHQRLFGPLAHSQFVRRPAPESCPNSKLERAYRRADAAIDHVVELLQAA